MSVYGDATLPQPVSVRFEPGLTSTQTVITRVSADGVVDFTNVSDDSVNVVAVVTGYVTRVDQLAIATTSLPDGTAGLAYNLPLAASGGVAPYTWEVSGLPPGLAASPDGILTGTPTSTGSSTVSVTVTDARQVTTSADFSLAVPTSLPAQCINDDCCSVPPRR